VSVDGTLNTRSSPSTSASIVGTHTLGDQGTVIGGPTSANGYTWYQIDYDSGADGWSVDDALSVN
jgi:uncharacterized protein YgiM (DUF1202 family)